MAIDEDTDWVHIRVESVSYFAAGDTDPSEGSASSLAKRPELNPRSRRCGRWVPPSWKE